MMTKNGLDKNHAIGFYKQDTEQNKFSTDIILKGIEII
jgi:hypothetical protein